MIIGAIILSAIVVFGAMFGEDLRTEFKARKAVRHLMKSTLQEIA